MSPDDLGRGDPRGDQTVIAAQLSQVFLRFHNAVVDDLSRRVSPPADLFAEAQRLVRWHYQWLIVHEYLRHIVTQELVDDILSSPSVRRFYKWQDEPFIPVEFAEAGRVPLWSQPAAPELSAQRHVRQPAVCVAHAGQSASG